MQEQRRDPQQGASQKEQSGAFDARGALRLRLLQLRGRRGSHIGPLASVQPGAGKVLAVRARAPLYSSLSASFVYDGDGRRVAQTINEITTYFVGNYYEVTGGAVTKYYYAGSQRVAERRGSSLHYLLGDHPSTGSGQAWAAPR